MTENFCVEFSKLIFIYIQIPIIGIILIQNENHWKQFLQNCKHFAIPLISGVWRRSWLQLTNPLLASGRRRWWQLCCYTRHKFSFVVVTFCAHCSAACSKENYRINCLSEEGNTVLDKRVLVLGPTFYLFGQWLTLNNNSLYSTHSTQQ